MPLASAAASPLSLALSTLHSRQLHSALQRRLRASTEPNGRLPDWLRRRTSSAGLKILPASEQVVRELCKPAATCCCTCDQTPAHVCHSTGCRSRPARRDQCGPTLAAQGPNLSLARSAPSRSFTLAQPARQAANKEPRALVAPTCCAPVGRSSNASKQEHSSVASLNSILSLSN